MSRVPDARDAYEEAFLGEVARLLPDADVVRLRSGGSAAQQPAETATGESLSTAAQAAAHHLVSACSAVFAGSEPPESLSLRWSSLGSPEVVHAQATARLVAESAGPPDVHGSRSEVPDPGAATARLQRLGWSTAIRRQSEGGFNLLGRLDGFRLDVVVQADAGLRAVRVSGPPIVAGELAPPLAEAESRQIPWPSAR